jgi:hypothetical protein
MDQMVIWFICFVCINPVSELAFSSNHTRKDFAASQNFDDWSRNTRAANAHFLYKQRFRAISCFLLGEYFDRCKQCLIAPACGSIAAFILAGVNV